MVVTISKVTAQDVRGMGADGRVELRLASEGNSFELQFPSLIELKKFHENLSTKIERFVEHSRRI